MEMTFGKYKGKSVEEVYKINPSYFTWMKENGLTSKDEYQYFVEVLPNEFPESFVWEVDIRSGFECWKCKKPMNVMLLFNPEIENELRNEFPIVSDLAHCKPRSFIPFSKSIGIQMEDRFSKTIGVNCVMHICPHCGMHQGDYHVVDDNHQETVLLQKLRISYDKSRFCWYEMK
ncbi:exodeoxyribonuclease X C-terminal domain-containing protein [Paenibacillus chitinolyticus]|uniref:exodeoxyribonuclease X C-terminal domain-containing protein n=1 Tax=Paenibacillus chitinolyticus TaxID=79263 RepID=UPI001C438880|nr:hypothetical protein [Paenibacillus chitinolyticus]